MRFDFAAQPSRLREGSLPSRLPSSRSSSAAVLSQDSLRFDFQRSTTRTRSRSSSDFRFIFDRLFQLGGSQTGLKVESASSGRSRLPATVGTATTNAPDLGNLSGNTQFNWSDTVGSTAKDHFFRFTLTRNNRVQLQLGQLSGNADLRLLNIDGQELTRSQRANLSNESIDRRLNAGTYYAQVLSDANTNVNYALRLNTKGNAADGGTTMGTALDAGNLNQMKRTYRNRISNTDPTDMYRFTLTEAGAVNLSLNRLSGDADLLLFNASGDEIAESSKHGRANESVKRQLNAGTYYVKVDSFDEGTTRYTLGMSTEVAGSTANSGAGDFANGSGNNSGNGAGNGSSSNSGNGFGNGNGSGSVTGSLSGAETLSSPVFSRSADVSAADRDDLYQFSLAQGGIFSADLTGTANRAGMRLIRDANNNGAIDPGEVLSTKSNLSAKVNRYLDRGTYFLQVEGDGSPVNYSVKTNFMSAGTNGSVIRITRTGKNSGGFAELQVALERNGKTVDQMLAISGVASKQNFRTGTQSQSGSMEPLPEGYWSLGDVEWASGIKGDYTRSWADPNDGLGPVWISMEPKFSTGRSAIGFHLDNNASRGLAGTVGCVGILNKSDLSRLVSWFDNSAPKLAIVDWSLGTVEV
ncbi:PPC domain-containing protein [Leptolyngbya ohadii]|uniref:PPC domain-containing protein n=1 Tax=Leptolyngbya ohadii TaxID=1962290 RepID=UPI000B59B004|nr:PPC domain-containing protein [Leptolyngbya ohadii]